MIEIDGFMLVLVNIFAILIGFLLGRILRWNERN